MAFLGETFDANELPQGNGGNYDPLPAGWYNANITAAELKPTKDGSGQYIKVRYDITGPSHQGRVAEGYRNSGGGKNSIRWSVDGKRVARANLAEALA